METHAHYDHYTNIHYTIQKVLIFLKKKMEKVLSPLFVSYEDLIATYTFLRHYSPLEDVYTDNTSRAIFV